MASKSQKPIDNTIRITVKEDITYLMNGRLRFSVTSTEINSDEEKK
ncbi:MAG: hypothetical protein ACTSSH_08965 [Candidatus Heimdallarchaeota archaeon]